VYHARKSVRNSQSFSKIMNNGHTVAKKDFTASFKSKNGEVFE
jgi:RNase P protein component